MVVLHSFALIVLFPAKLQSIEYNHDRRQRWARRGALSEMISLICFTTSTRFMKTPQLPPTILVHCIAG